MALVLTTHALLQRRHFRTTRRRLEGREVIIFSPELHEKKLAASRLEAKHHSILASSSRLALRVFLSLILVGSILTIGSLVIPELYARMVPETTPVSSALSQVEQPSLVVPIKKYEPAFDPTLPQGTWINIPKIGVETQAQDTLDPNQALDTGVWLVPDFARPGEGEEPIIMAAHRFGWKWWWQNDYWKKNSFNLLPETQVGDRIEVIYNQRKWVYEIYTASEGTEISDYEADLILYTCKFLNSPDRYFRYAKLVTE